MAIDKPVKIGRGRKKNMLFPVLGMIAVALVISLAIALLWQNLSGDGDVVKQSSSSQDSSSQIRSTSVLSETVSSEPSEPEQRVITVGELVNVLPESDRVNSGYFDDAVFVGDSLTEGIQLYDMMANTTVLAGKGINLDTIYSSPVIKREDGTRISIMEGIRDKQYKKMYVMLGGNEVRDVEKSVFIERYGKVLDDLMAAQPDAVVYVQSILPVTKNNNYNMDNDKIDEYNVALSELSKQKGVYFVNVAESIKDENGMLPDEASPADGMHFGPEYYNKWFEYLKLHTVDSTRTEADLKPRAPVKESSEQDSIQTQSTDAASQTDAAAPVMEPSESIEEAA